MTTTTENFGHRMNQLRQERGIPLGGPGRRRIIDKHGDYVNAVERAFAEALPEEARRYIEELAPKDPERCPEHHRILQCPAKDCPVHSQRTAYDHKAATYIFDRIMGRPTSRSENSVTVALVNAITGAFADAFAEVNGIEDADERREQFALRLVQLGETYGGH